MNRPRILDPNAYDWKLNSNNISVPLGHTVDDISNLLHEINRFYSEQSRRILHVQPHSSWGGHYTGPLTSIPIARWRWSNTWLPSTRHIIYVLAKAEYWGTASSNPTISYKGSSPQIMVLPDNQLRLYTMVLEQTVSDATDEGWLEMTITGGSTSLYIENILVAEMSTEYEAISVIPKAGEAITSRHIEKARQGVYEMFLKHCQPVFGFSSWMEDNISTTQWFDETAWVFSTTSFVNPIDGVSSSRTASTPGFLVPCYGLGRGHYTNNVKLRINVYGRVDAGSGTLRFSGPLGDQDFVIDTTSFAWTSSYLDLDPTKWPGDATTGANKIDPLGRIETGATWMQIVAVSCYLEWS